MTLGGLGDSSDRHPVVGKAVAAIPPRAAATAPGVRQKLIQDGPFSFAQFPFGPRLPPSNLQP